MTIDILDLPVEIQFIIGTYLDIRSLLSCIRVCQHFRKTYISHVWRDIIFRGPPRIQHQSLQENAALVETLVLHRYIPKKFCFIKFCRLKTLRLVDLSKCVSEATSASCVDLPVAAAVLAKRNPWILHLELSYVQTEISEKFWTIVATEWRDPISLSVRCRQAPKGTEAEEDDKSKQNPIEAFWSACARFKELTLDLPSSMMERDKTSLKFTTLKNLKKLTLARAGQLSDLDELRGNINTSDHRQRSAKVELAMIQTCPNLEYLCWDRSATSFFSGAGFMEALRRQVWANLSSLLLRRMAIKDEAMADILSLVSKRLIELDLRESSGFGSLSFNVLSERHFVSLKRLCMLGCNRFTGEMALSALKACSHLESMAADYIYMEDIAEHKDVVTGNPEPWACYQTLRELQVFVARRQHQAKPLEPEPKRVELISRGQTLKQLNIQVFRQLSTLNRLKSLTLSMDIFDLQLLPSEVFKAVNEGASLDLRLSSGLDWLANLELLEHFGFERTRQELGPKELHWMKMHWRQLKTVNGQLSHDQEQHKSLASILKAAGVSCSEADNNNSSYMRFIDESHRGGVEDNYSTVSEIEY
ncbi:hypothetical protein BX616_010395 [Lobosporangium transversale]|uniref:F-box domain-containing protein n=1 Tax=Lobosporangium transversale TaxID=64571 RepID=A0A1Y2GFB7_9FUNG|nr:hypothetical protein BCR41DRAFT_424587 [Lobosporangium transversale]KAF9918058.1 hypothetical protein BX616_010395 [Lobosporangium transversale]ORZ07965.1 hypothetical protein BCR41DRAFT_424587 [Lobosporangium transversale]|eukprot:XP_021878199.1 hypothetical protein BCR41DRAFT_424587 [Lobosporangium transversale]